MIKMKNHKKIIISAIIVAVIAAVAICIFVFFIGNNNAPKAVAQRFNDSLFPNINTQEIENCVGEKVYAIRFDDGGYFADRYSRTRDQIVYYYGEEFVSELSNMEVTDTNEADKKSITKEYKSKYSLTVDDAKTVSFTVTLKSEYGEKSRNQSLTVLKIDGKWFVYDYDAYWFAFI